MSIEKGMSEAQIAESITNATRDVFSTMLGLEVEAGQHYVDGAPGPTAGVVSLIGLAGRWVGTGSVACSSEFACKASSLLLMAEFPAVNDEVLDAFSEITNMIIGNVKTALEVELGPMGLSIPTVIYGRNFTTRSVGKNEWIVVPFECPDGHMEVQVCLAPNREVPGSGRVAMANPGTAVR